MDLIGPTPVSARGNHYLLVMTDSRTRYAVADPLRSKTAEEVVGALTTEWIYKFTPPRRLRCDRGAEFLAEVGRKVYALFGIDFRPSSSFHPNTQGAVERLNQTLWNIVLKMTADDKDDWDLAIPRVLHGYNATPHRVLGISPFEAMYMRRSRMPFDIEVQLDEKELDPLNANAWVRQRSLVHKDMTHYLDEHWRKEDRRRGLAYSPFKPGDLVWRRARNPGKDSFRWIGPNVVEECLVNACKVKTEQGSILVISWRDLKRYRGRGPVSGEECVQEDSVPVPDEHQTDYEYK